MFILSVVKSCHSFFSLWNASWICNWHIKPKKALRYIFNMVHWMADLHAQSLSKWRIVFRVPCKGLLVIHITAVTSSLLEKKKFFVHISDIILIVYYWKKNAIQAKPLKMLIVCVLWSWGWFVNPLFISCQQMFTACLNGFIQFSVL